MQKKAEQLEIFSPVNSYGQATPKKFQFSFLTHIHSHERIILVFISLSIIGLVSFSFGVEHGKKISARKVLSDNFDLAKNSPVVIKQNSQAAIATAPVAEEQRKVVEKPKPLAPVKQIIITKIEKPKIEKPKAKTIKIEETKIIKIKTQVKQNITPEKKQTKTSGYTIQVASFKAKNQALKEVELLKKYGFQPALLNKGNYLIVCVGNYTDKDKASSVLKKLKEKYQDSFIRSL